MYRPPHHRPGLFAPLLLAVLVGLLAAGALSAVAQEATRCHEGDVTLEVQESGILVAWMEQQSVIVHDIFRKGPGEATFVHVGQAPSDASSFLDEDVSRGTTYTYRVDVKFDTTGPGTGTSSFCEEPTATAIPFFPSTVAWTAVAVGALAFYVHLRRR